MESYISLDEGIWTTAQFKTSKIPLATPRIVLIQETKSDLPSLSFNDSSCCVAICKRACLQKVTGYSLTDTASTISRCTSKTVVIVECRAPKEPLEESADLSLTSSHMLQPQLDCLLFACEEFLTNFGFFKNEVVWVRPIEPLPLERVVLTPAEDSDDSVETLSEVVKQLYNQCQEGIVIANTRFQLLHQVGVSPGTPLPQDTSTERAEPPANGSNSEAEWLTSTCSPDSSDSDDQCILPPPLKYNVLETTPVLQGRMTRDTAIVVVPFDSSSETPNEVGGALSPSSAQGDELFVETLSPSLPRYLPPPRNRAVSASDILLEDSGQQPNMSPSVEGRQPTAPPVVPTISVVTESSLVIEARLAEEFTLLHHYIVLPKLLARQHNMWELQNVLVTAKWAGSALRGKDPLINGVVTLSNDLKSTSNDNQDEAHLFTGTATTRRHLAIVRVYEDEDKLEELVPRVRLGHHYSKEDLCVAYLHPELMFNLFPETLSGEPRQYLVEIENMMATPSPSPLDLTRESPHPLSTPAKHLTATKPIKMDIKKMFLAHVATPTSPFSNELVKELIQKHLIESCNKIVMSKGDVFSLATDHGQLILKVMSIQPHFDNGGISGEDYSFTGQSVSYLPHLFNPSSPESYWDYFHPPGLEEYSHTLFQYFLPYMMPKRFRPRVCCTSVLISGPPGVGKSTVIRSVARRCRLNVIEFNCYEFCNEGLRLAEQKLSNAFDKVVRHVPCVMVLREINVLAKQDLSLTSASNEPRIDTAFETMVSNINDQVKESNFPLIVVGVSSYPNEVSPRIQHSFLHELKMSPPTQEQRVRILKGLSHQYPISRDIDVVDIARRSAGFVLGDYTELFTKAKKVAMVGVSSLMNSKNSADNGWLKAHNMSIFGTLITQNHLDSALNLLHSSHSGYIGAPKIPNVKWKDVGGLEEAKKEILETIQLPLLHPELFAGGLRRSGILLHGVPGTGKTLLAKAVATECSLNFLSVKGPELINMYVGQTEENIREIFSRARGAAPCVVFFDELDSLAPNRGKSGDSGGVMDRVVSQLLAELDGLDQKKDVFVIGATNRYDLIDPALLRPGRFDRLIFLDVCNNVQSKLTILKAITRKFNLHEDVDLHIIAERCPPNLTGADLYALCADAMLASIRNQISDLEAKGLSDADWNGSLMVTHQHFLSSLSTLKPSITEEDLEMYRKKQFLQGAS